MRALVTMMPIAGHVAPMTGLVAELLCRGHQVVVHTTARHEPRFVALGAEVLPWSAADFVDEEDLAAAGRGRRWVPRFRAAVERTFYSSGPAQVRDLLAELDRNPPDVILGDALAIGAGLVGELRALPWVAVHLLALAQPTPQLPPPGFPVPPAGGPLGQLRDAGLWQAYRLATARYDKAHNAVRAELGLPQDHRVHGAARVSPWLTLVTGTPSLELPRDDLPAALHFVGRLTPVGLPTTPPLLPRTARRPMVVVTQGTHHVDPTDLVEPTLLGLAGEEVDVVATVGRHGAIQVGCGVPENARLVDFVDFDAVLPDTAVLVTNGGWGSILAGLATSVPLVVAGGDLDRPANAARVARAGAGIDLRTGHPKGEAVAAAVRTVLGEFRYREQAGRLSAELAELGGSARAVDLVERLASTGAPVRRTVDYWERPPLDPRPDARPVTRAAGAPRRVAHR